MLSADTRSQITARTVGRNDVLTAMRGLLAVAGQPQAVSGLGTYGGRRYAEETASSGPRARARRWTPSRS